jgi:hypothetical protein
MGNPDELETGFYWIHIGQQEPEVAQWQSEWGQWLVTGRDLPLSDDLSTEVVVLGGPLIPPPCPRPQRPWRRTPA